MDGNGEICIEGEKVILMLYLHFETPLTSLMLTEPAKSFLSLLITRQFYWLVALLAVWRPMMALKLEGLELVRCYCSDRRAASRSLDSRRKRTLTALPFT